MRTVATEWTEFANNSLSPGLTESFLPFSRLCAQWTIPNRKRRRLRNLALIFIPSLSLLESSKIVQICRILILALLSLINYHYNSLCNLLFYNFKKLGCFRSLLPLLPRLLIRRTLLCPPQSADILTQKSRRATLWSGSKLAARARTPALPLTQSRCSTFLSMITAS